MSLARRIANALRPPPKMSVAQWADNRRVLGRTSAEPGRWRTDRVPYLREIMDDLTPGSGVVELIVMKASQVAYTEGIVLNGVGHSMEVDPGPTAIIQPTQDTARQHVLRRLDPMIESTPVLAAMVGSRRQNSENTLSYKAFAGGFIKIGNASSASELASDPLRYVWCDEVDRWEDNVGGEGDPVQLLRARTITFGARRRFVAGSTPVWDERSRIQSLYREGDQRRYHQPCPRCGELILIEWEAIRWRDETEREAVTDCACCGLEITEEDRPGMLLHGEWVPTNPDAPPGHHSYWIEGQLSPWQSWTAMLRLVEEAIESGSTDRMRVVWNTVLGRPFRGGMREAVEWQRLYDRRGQGVRGTAPASTSILVAGADVQSDRIEVEVLAISEGWRQHTVDYLVLPGDPTQSQVWEDLGAVLERQWTVEGSTSTMQIRRMGLDTGYRTTHAYMFARKYGLHRVMAIKGTGYRTDIIGRPTAQDIDGPAGRIPQGVYVWPVGGDLVKDLLHHWLRLRYEEPGELPEGWCTWPDLDEEYFQQLCAEQRVQRGSGWAWEKIRARNEALDCRVYALAAAYACGVNRWGEAQWRAARLSREPSTPTPSEPRDGPGPGGVHHSDSSWLSGRGRR